MPRPKLHLGLCYACVCALFLTGAQTDPDEGTSKKAKLSLDFPDLNARGPHQRVVPGHAPASSVALRLLFAHSKEKLGAETRSTCNALAPKGPPVNNISELIGAFFFTPKTAGAAYYIGYHCVEHDNSRVECSFDRFPTKHAKGAYKSISFLVETSSYTLDSKSIRCKNSIGQI